MTKIVKLGTGREMKCEVVGAERVAWNGVKIVPVVLEDGRSGLVAVENISDIVVDVAEANSKAVIDLLVAEGVDHTVDVFGDIDGDTYQITVEGWSHQVYIVATNEGFELSTLHLENSKNYGQYEETYKNVAFRKKASAVLTYINKYM